MARDAVSTASFVARTLRTFRRPWPILLAGLVCTVIGLLLSQTPYTPTRLIFMAVGLLLTAIAVARRLQTAGWELEDRAESAGLLALSAFVALLCYLGMEPSWDSGQVFLGVLIAVALLGSVIVLLPRTGRRIAASVLLLLHFGGILTAVTAVPPRNDPAPWLSMHLFSHFYRHYLTFAYFTNAYHFYSPDPGPPSLLWFHVEYADDSARWVKVPNRRESPVLLHHQRMLAASENASTPMFGMPFDAKTKADYEESMGRPYELLPGIPHDTVETIVYRRRIAQTMPFTDPRDHNRPAPIRLLQGELDSLISQYSEPQETARRLIASFARHIGRTSPHLEDARIPVKAVRVYRLTHTLISPREFAAGRDPLDETTLMPFYMGKYDLDGRLLDPKDPFLFWYLPILQIPKRYPEPGALLKREPQPGPQKVINFMEIHATQSDKLAQIDDKP